jgi:hypothetical protein
MCVIQELVVIAQPGKASRRDDLSCLRVWGREEEGILVSARDMRVIWGLHRKLN